MEELKALLLANENWLMERVLVYAERQSYTKYTSNLVEAWRLSIIGLSETILRAADSIGSRVPEFFPDEDYTRNPIVAFGVTEAQLHRKRGIRLPMFLGLLKYYRQAYQDLIREKIEDSALGAHYGMFIVRCFDLFELALTIEWNSSPGDEIVGELQRANRHLTHEKNRYLTLFKSLSEPAFLINRDQLVENFNVAAARLLDVKDLPEGYYLTALEASREKPSAPKGATAGNGTIIGRNLGEVMPWLAEMLAAMGGSPQKVLRRELPAEIGGHTRYFLAVLSGMLGISDRCEGAVVVLSDITKHKQLEEKILRLATIDPLTGAHNRRSFLEKAKSELGRSRRYHRPLSLLMIDIDHFKKINDTYGHHFGDLALKVFSKTCLGSLRETDLFGRLGGEEFAAVLTETDERTAVTVAERLRQQVSRAVVSEGNIRLSCNASIGISTLQDQKRQIEEIIQEADQAMYLAKRRGRNRVATHSELN